MHPVDLDLRADERRAHRLRGAFRHAIGEQDPQPRDQGAEQQQRYDRLPAEQAHRHSGRNRRYRPYSLDAVIARYSAERRTRSATVAR